MTAIWRRSNGKRIEACCIMMLELHYDFPLRPKRLAKVQEKEKVRLLKVCLGNDTTLVEAHKETIAVTPVHPTRKLPVEVEGAEREEK